MTIIGTVIENGGGERLLIPEEELQRVAAMAGCEHCGGDLPPRTHTGGKPRRFCSDKCRSAAHAGCTPPSNATVKSTSNAPSLPMELPTVAKPAGEEFDWRDKDSLVIPSQPALAVYFNPRGEVVIRQEGHYGPDEDQFVYIQIQNLHPLISKLSAIERGDIVPDDD